MTTTAVLTSQSPPATGTAAIVVAPRPRAAYRLAAAGLAVLVFVATFFLYTRHTDFPLRYHPDEPGKVDQVLSDTRNHNHPTLMLDLTQLAAHVLHVEQEPAHVARVGRGVSAFFAAGCVTFLAIAGYLEAGLLGMVLVGALVGTSPFLFTYAHYMKEDAGLMFGVGMFLLASRMLWVRWRHRWNEVATVLFLGAACAFAGSGKYIGAASVLVGWLILFCGNRWWWTDLALRPLAFATAAAVCAWGLNYRVIHEWADARDSVAASVRQPLENNFNSVVPIPNAYYLHVINEVTPLPVKVLAAAAVVLLVLTWRRRNGWDVLVVVLLGVVVALLSFSCTLAFPRYALPAVVQLHLMAALALAWTWEWLRTASPSPAVRTACAVVAAGAVAADVYACAGAYRQFSNDSRDRLMAWLNQNGKKGETAVADNYAGFASLSSYGDSAYPDTVQVDGAMWAANLGELDDLKTQRCTYVIVCDLAYARFTDGYHVPNSGQEDRFDHHRAWYERLFKDLTPVWASIPAPNLYGYTNPEIRVYRIDGTAR
jgi:hypothetical protein